MLPFWMGKGWPGRRRRRVFRKDWRDKRKNNQVRNQEDHHAQEIAGKEQRDDRHDEEDEACEGDALPVARPFPVVEGPARRTGEFPAPVPVEVVEPVSRPVSELAGASCASGHALTTAARHLK